MSEKDYYDEMRTFITDERGNKVRRGLSIDETAIYERGILDREARAPRNVGELALWRELHKKHEAARLEAVSAEIAVREMTKH